MNWKLVTPWILVLILTVSYISTVIYIKQDSITPRVPIKDNRIDSLTNIITSLNAELDKSRHEYDSVQQNVKSEIIKIQVKNAKDISAIHTFTVDQRDSVWAVIEP